ncbi:LOW QUALITY PROTEIN: potassium channel subfamily K member 6-like [Polyodon spathula]|uniref:LOW QUALITY PROTEIN: potassium channel subfamily K member 6-like n=1 Tax=Polyodon spathula TaxID=7913 RepID=UPI001B7F3AE2|nr:LOW QUALITY PROTEIN: potassium channel subfamily K member 6-like [Polyodon spathula]
MSSNSRSGILVFLFFVFYLTYLFLGAAIFSSIERPEEIRLRGELRILKANFLNRSCVDSSSLETFLEHVLTASKYGVSVLNNASVNTNWDFASSLFFASTLLTTVGYGQTTPLSDGGKAFSIAFALLGVPFTMLVLTASLQRLMHLFTYWPMRVCQLRAGWSSRTASKVHFVLLLVAVVVCFFVVPAAIFSTIEHTWTFLDSFYFCFISLCTIGLGDYVPGEQHGQALRPLYKIAVMVYLFVGLMAMLLVLRSFHKACDIHGLTSLFHLPKCEEEEEEEEEDQVQIIDSQESSEPDQEVAHKQLIAGIQPSYNSINQ